MHTCIARTATAVMQISIQPAARQPVASAVNTQHGKRGTSCAYHTCRMISAMVQSRYGMQMLARLKAKASEASWAKANNSTSCFRSCQASKLTVQHDSFCDSAQVTHKTNIGSHAGTCTCSAVSFHMTRCLTYSPSNAQVPRQNLQCSAC
jgi:hypothetical protein